jgi:hypothetical protein
MGCSEGASAFPAKMGPVVVLKTQGQVKGWKTVVWNSALSASDLLLYLTDQSQTPAKPPCTQEHIVAREPKRDHVYRNTGDRGSGPHRGVSKPPRNPEVKDPQRYMRPSWGRARQAGGNGAVGRIQVTAHFQ